MFRPEQAPKGPHIHFLQLGQLFCWGSVSIALALRFSSLKQITWTSGGIKEVGEPLMQQRQRDQNVQTRTGAERTAHPFFTVGAVVLLGECIHCACIALFELEADYLD